MAGRPSKEEPARARLYVIAPAGADAQVLAVELAGMLAAADVAAVLVRFAEADERTLINRAKILAPAIQDKGAALLLDGHPELVARAGADGAHLAGIDALRAALPRLKPDRIAGAGELSTRHDAMLAAEAGADYVMFGEPRPHHRRPPFEAVVERVAWWAELFEVPCVGYADSLEEVGALAAAGADFVALGEALFADPRGPAAAIAEAAGRLRALEPVT
jgi:thiamine-phosphate pyrophosphorylase